MHRAGRSDGAECIHRGIPLLCSPTPRGRVETTDSAGSLIVIALAFDQFSFNVGVDLCYLFCRLVLISRI